MDTYFKNGQPMGWNTNGRNSGVGSGTSTDWFSTVNKAVSDRVVEDARKRQTPPAPGQPSNPGTGPGPTPQNPATAPRNPASTAARPPEKSALDLERERANARESVGMSTLQRERATPVTTYVSNITLPGAGTTRIGFSDANSQREAEALMRQILAARGSSS